MSHMTPLPRETVAYDPVDGSRSELHKMDGQWVLKRVTSRAATADFLSANRSLSNVVSRDPRRRMRRAARLDERAMQELYLLWCGANGRNHVAAKKGGFRAMMKDQEFLWSVLNNPDFRYLRIDDGVYGPKESHRVKKHFIMSSV